MVDITIIYKQVKENKKTYEKYSELIDREMSKRKMKWHLKAVNYMDFDDVCQIIKTHVLKKIHLYNPDNSAFVNWLNRLISNQIINLLRNHYGSFAKVCNKCYASEGEDGCQIYGKQCAACPAFFNWTLSKKNAYDIRLTLPTENHFNEVSSMPDQSIDVEKSIGGFHIKMLDILKDSEVKVYKLSYIDGKNDSQVAANIYKKPIGEVTKKDIKAIENLKCRIIKRGREVVYSGEIDISGNSNAK